MIRLLIPFLCLLFVVQATFSQPPQSVTETSLTSDVGDYVGQGQNYHYPSGVGTYMLDVQDQSGDGLTDWVNIGFGNTVDHWNFIFSSRRTGRALTPGFYDNATGYTGTGTSPGLGVFGNGRSCSQTTGSFTVHQAEYNYVGSSIQLVRFAATFEQHCEGLAPAFYGTVYYNYAPSGPTYSISGQVVNNLGVPVPNAAVSLFGSRTKSGIANSAGQYNFDQLLDLGIFRVVASAPGHTPVNRLFRRLAGNQLADITLIPNYTIEGRALNEHGFPLANLTISLTGSQTRSVQTDSLGRYSFTTLPANGNYVVTPLTPFFVFEPRSRSWNTLPGDQSADFVGLPARYSIGGRIVSPEGNGLGGIRVDLEVGDSEGVSTVTDANGFYVFASLPSGANYQVRPAESIYVFSPSARSIPLLSRDFSDQNFVGTITRYSINGFVLDTSGNGVGDAIVTLSGSAGGPTLTDVNGFYSFPSLPAGGTYTITPTKSGFTFAPASRTTNSLSANIFANFVGGAAPVPRHLRKQSASQTPTPPPRPAS